MRRHVRLGLTFGILLLVLALWRVSGGGAAVQPQRDLPREGDRIAALNWTRSRSSQNSKATTEADTAAAPTTPATTETKDARDCQQKCGTACEPGTTECPPLCRRNEDCSQDRRCHHTTDGLWRCLASDCSTDDDCGTGTCVYSAGLEHSIKRCVAVATMGGGFASGAVCRDEKDCNRGLMCADGLCLPTHCAASSDCPHGSSCSLLGSSMTERACIAGCSTDADCPEGRKCRDHGDGNKCVADFDADCLSKGCPDGLSCATLERGPKSTVAECRKSCSGDGDPVCGDGGACTELGERDGRKINACLPRCHEDADCAKGRACHWKPGLGLDIMVCLTKADPEPK